MELNLKFVRMEKGASGEKNGRRWQKYKVIGADSNGKHHTMTCFDNMGVKKDGTVYGLPLHELVVGRMYKFVLKDDQYGNSLRKIDNIDQDLGKLVEESVQKEDAKIQKFITAFFNQTEPVHWNIDYMLATWFRTLHHDEYFKMEGLFNEALKRKHEPKIQQAGD